jgi:hypothetical protein
MKVILYVPENPNFLATTNANAHHYDISKPHFCEGMSSKLPDKTPWTMVHLLLLCGASLLCSMMLK